VVAEAAALADTSAIADLHGERPDDEIQIIRTSEEFVAALTAKPRPPDPLPVPAPNPAVIVGGPILPPALLADLVARGAATIRPLIHPGKCATRTALPSLARTGRLRPLPRPHMPLPRLPAARRPVRRRSHHPLRPGWGDACLQRRGAVDGDLRHLLVRRRNRASSRRTAPAAPTSRLNY
jgi:hypothetical protein